MKSAQQFFSLCILDWKCDNLREENLVLYKASTEKERWLMVEDFQPFDNVVISQGRLHLASYVLKL